MQQHDDEECPQFNIYSVPSPTQQDNENHDPNSPAIGSPRLFNPTRTSNRMHMEWLSKRVKELSRVQQENHRELMMALENRRNPATVELQNRVFTTEMGNRLDEHNREIGKLWKAIEEKDTENDLLKMRNTELNDRIQQLQEEAKPPPFPAYDFSDDPFGQLLHQVEAEEHLKKAAERKKERSAAVARAQLTHAGLPFGDPADISIPGPVDENDCNDPFYKRCGKCGWSPEDEGQPGGCEYGLFRYLHPRLIVGCRGATCGLTNEADKNKSAFTKGGKLRPKKRKKRSVVSSQF